LESSAAKLLPAELGRLNDLNGNSAAPHLQHQALESWLRTRNRL
jgi:hypothetical protein